MSEYFELAKALAEHQKALVERAAVLKDIHEAIFGDPGQPFPYYDPNESSSSDEELERRSDNRRAWRQPYDWMTEPEN